MRVPDYGGRKTAQAVRGGDSSVRIPSGAFGDASGMAAIGQGLNEASERLSSIGLHIKKREDTRAAKDAYLKFKETVNLNLYGDKESKTPGMLDRRGEQSKGVVEDAHKFIRKAREQAAKGLMNGTQSELFNQFADRDQAAYLEKTYAHQFKELHALEVDQTKSLINVSTQDLMRSTTDEEWGKAKEELESHLRTYAKITGLDQTSTHAVFEKQISTARINQVKDLIGQENYTVARSYLDKHKGEIDPDAFVGLEAQVVDAERGRTAYDIAYAVSREMGDKPLSEQQDEIRKRSGSPEVERSSMSFHRSFYDTTQQQIKENLIFTENQFKAAAAGAETPDQLYKVWQQANSISDPKIKKAALAAVKMGGKSPAISDPDSLKSARGDITRGMGKEELEAKYWRKISAGDLKELTDQSDDVNGQRVNTFMLNLDQKLEQEIPGKSKKANARRGMFADQMKQFVKSFKAENDRYPTDKELSDHKNYLTQEVVYDSGAGFFNMQDSEQRYLLGTVSAESYDIPEVENALKEKGWAKGMPDYERVRATTYQNYFSKKGGQ